MCKGEDTRKLLQKKNEVYPSSDEGARVEEEEQKERSDKCICHAILHSDPAVSYLLLELNDALFGLCLERCLGVRVRGGEGGRHQKGVAR